jgi:hypothetical protein
MEPIFDALSRIFTDLAGRAGGPLNFRLVVMPTVVTILAILADRRDAREGRPALLGAFFMDRVERQRLMRLALKDIGRVFIVAIVLDTVYQIIVFRWVYPGEVLVVAVACAIVPYVLVRGPVIRLLRMLFGTHKGSGTSDRGSEGSRHE